MVAGWACAPLMLEVKANAPPTSAGGLLLPAPRIKRDSRLGVPLAPLQSAQPEGIEATLPDHMMMPPTGKSLE